MNQFDIVGLSLAEIALVVVFVLLAVFAPAYSRIRKELKIKEVETTKLKQQLDETEREAARLHQQYEAERPNLRSKATPSCFELKKTSNRWLFTLVVRGPDKYELEGHEVTLRELSHQYDSEITQAKRDDCRLSIRISSGEGLSGREYQSALIQLGQTFYMTQSGTQ